ncbi:MAG: hypothetical protein NUV69_03070 [Candidatus Curtissbacteria bacterium]|nr:hypothetical protein [Candidatus Curtissbacteria bacterium]
MNMARGYTFINQGFLKQNGSGHAPADLGWEDEETKAAREGEKDFIKESVKEEEKVEQKVNDLVEKSDKCLVHIRGIFPFDFFPDEVTVDMNKVNFVSNSLLTKRVHSVFIKDVSDVFTTDGIFFSRLSVVDEGFIENEIAVNFLHKSDANRARRIIQGLVVAAKQDIDMSKFGPGHFDKQKLDSLGQAKGAE